jgi:hypothetical protein
MSLQCSSSAGRHVNAAIFLMVAVIFLAPPLVRATVLRDGTPPLRLNRGFEQPPAKCDVGQADMLVRLAFPDITRPVPPAERVTVSEQALPPAAPDRLPDPVRGPPSAL